MARGQILSVGIDPFSGRDDRRQISGRSRDQASIHHHPFFIIPAYDDAMQRLIFVSHRTGRPEIFAEDRETGKLIQLTERESIGEYSVYPSHDGRYVYFTAGTGAYRVDSETLKEEQLVDFGKINLREAGMVADAMGTTALSFDDRYWAIRFSVNGRSLSCGHRYPTAASTGLSSSAIPSPISCSAPMIPTCSITPVRSRIASGVVKRDGTGKPPPLSARAGRMDHARKLDSRHTRTGIRRLEQGHSRHPCRYRRRAACDLLQRLACRLQS